MFRHAFFQSTTVGLKFYTLKALLLGEKGPSTSIIGVSFFSRFVAFSWSNAEPVLTAAAV